MDVVHVKMEVDQCREMVDLDHQFESRGEMDPDDYPRRHVGSHITSLGDNVVVVELFLPRRLRSDPDLERTTRMPILKPTSMLQDWRKRMMGMQTP